MNRKCFIISFTLLVFFFLTYVEKTHGCHPAGAGCNAGETGDCGATIKSAKWSPGNLEIQVVTPDSAPQAFGHFTFADDQKHGGRFLKRPVFVNCQECTTINNCQINPFTSNWTFDPSQTPQKGVWFDIWISVYWFCTKKHGKSVRCTSEDIQFRDIVR